MVVQQVHHLAGVDCRNWRQLANWLEQALGGVLFENLILVVVHVELVVEHAAVGHWRGALDDLSELIHHWHLHYVKFRSWSEF